MASYHSITDPFKRPFHSSMAKTLIDGGTPAHVRYAIENGTKQTRSMFLGTLAHVMLLQPQDFLDNWEMAETEKRNGQIVTISKNTNKYKDWKAKKIAAGEPFYHIEELRKAEGMIESLSSAHWIEGVINGPGHPELEVKARFHQYNMNVCIAIDKLVGTLIVDLKKVQDGSKEGFGKSIRDYGYDLQAALYVDTLDRATQGQYTEDIRFVWVCVEEKSPHVPSCYFATQDHLNMGRDKYRRAMAIWQNCLESGEFPGYETTPQEPDMGYYYNRKAAELNY